MPGCEGISACKTHFQAGQHTSSAMPLPLASLSLPLPLPLASLSLPLPLPLDAQTTAAIWVMRSLAVDLQEGAVYG